MKNKKLTLMMGIALISAAFLSACTVGGRSFSVGQLQRESESVAMPNGDHISVRIDMPVGKLSISGGASDLLEADFVYNVAALMPEIELLGGRLSITTPESKLRFSSIFDIDDFRNDWDLVFSDEMEMSLDIELGIGESNLDLGSLALERLDIDAGVGDFDLNLIGSSLEILRVSAGVGELLIDMSGDWAQDVDVKIEAGIGEVTLILPRGVGVTIDVDGGITDINASGFSYNRGQYFNDAFGSSDIVIDIRIDAGVGEVNLLLGN